MLFKKVKYIIIPLIFIISIFTLFFTGILKVYKPAGSDSSMGVVVGPIVGLDENVLIGVGDKETTSNDTEWSSSDGVAAKPIREDGSLYAFKTIYVKNNLFNEKYNDWQYLSYIKYFEITRTDGRYIYDDDGILDTYLLSDTNTDEIVNYEADLYIRTQIMPYNYNGFLGTVLNTKWTHNSNYEIALRTSTEILGTENHEIKDDDANTMGSGNYRNAGKNPGQNRYKLFELPPVADHFVSISINGTAYWENGWWGGTGSNKTFNETLIFNYIKLGAKDWTNELITNYPSANFMGKDYYYSPVPFSIIARNLNNRIKIDNVLTTPMIGTGIVPYKDGHHISITKDGTTRIDFEKGRAGVYETSYAVIDTKIPDINFENFTKHSANNKQVKDIVTNEYGSKMQEVYEGVFSGKIAIKYSANTPTESPEQAFYRFNGEEEWHYLPTNITFTQEGDYEVLVEDMAGNTLVSKFRLDNSAPTYNYDRLLNAKDYKVSKWFLTNIPSGYENFGTYSFATKDLALDFASKFERDTFVTSFELCDVNDFIYTNLVASGDSVKKGKYYYYKSRDNPNLYVYYFNEELLNSVIEYYASKYVSNANYYKQSSILETNNYGNVLDESMYSNIVQYKEKNVYLINNFVFLQNEENIKIYYDYYEDTTTNWTQFQYGKTFENQVSASGVYAIKEVDDVDNEIVYYIAIDNNAPLIDVELKFYGTDKVVNTTISKFDIPKNGKLIYYLESFKITNIIDLDNEWVCEIKYPSNTIQRFSSYDEYPNFDGVGGEVEITAYDRQYNSFTFYVALLGKAPTVEFTSLNSNTQLKIKINAGGEYNALRDLQIYRNNICLNNENGYDEKPIDDSNELIFIDINTLQYIFSKGGMYKVSVTDVFGRNLDFEYTFTKNLPNGDLIGVENNGITKNEVQFIFNHSKYYVVILLDNATFNAEEIENNNLTIKYFYPLEDSEQEYQIFLYENEDNENYNIYSFKIRTIKPNIILYGVEPDGVTGGEVYATWEMGENENYISSYNLNGIISDYRKGQMLSIEGSYVITLIDEIGNENTVNFSIDKTLEFSIENIYGELIEIENLQYINFDIKIINNEPLKICVMLGDLNTDYEFGLFILDEGQYQVVISDDYGNTILIEFVIDKTPPNALLYGVENYGITNKNVYVLCEERNVIAYYILKNVRFKYSIGDEVVLTGKYELIVEDRASNKTSFVFEIDKIILFDINTYSGGITNDRVRIIAYESLNIVMYKDNKHIEYEFENFLNEDGEYSFTLTDNLGNTYYSYFRILTKKKQNLKHLLLENIVVTSVIKDKENYEFQVLENELYLYDEGKYKVNILDTENNKNYSFEITIDTSPPTLELVNVENGGSTKRNVILRNVSETPYELFIVCDGLNFDYTLGKEIEKSGRFTVTLLDEAGNFTVYEFEKVYTFNASAIAILAGLGVIAVIVIIFIVRNKKRYYTNDEIVEEIETTTSEEEIIIK